MQQRSEEYYTERKRGPLNAWNPIASDGPTPRVYLEGQNFNHKNYRGK
jgi:hypothetical protein